ncbi:iron-siderophore ABC transporter substrate-binding protein [Paenibacillus sp.]|uniref:ABC transporter substrate-binding protein n=1 Tax=Paenibacillus sp. TaxID=58172 RepID=UPI002810A321|nr:iron-siderophore ABC transporter substrate-binding protein [Paenibacillus sp.]
MKSYSKALGFLLIFVIAIAGCGGGNAATEGGDPTTGAGEVAAETPAGEEAPAAEPAAEEPAAIALEDSKGEVVLPKPATKVVTLEWTYAEDLIAVGVQPVGNADNENYKRNVSDQAALDADVADVGTRQEPNLEAIAALQPDLIVGVAFRHEKILDQLNAIAPTLLFNPYPDEASGVDQYGEMEETFRTIAAAVGKAEEADKVLADLAKHYDDAKTKLEQAGKSGAEIVLTQAYSNQNAADLRLFTSNSLAIATLEKIGLKNAWSSDKFEAYGFSTASVEALPAVQQANFLYIVQDNDDVFATKLKDNPVWTGLQFVKEERAYPLGGSTWPFGGPVSAKVFVDRTVEVLTK